MNMYAPKQEVDYLPLDKMVLEGYQRKTKQEQVQDIVDEFNEARLNALIVHRLPGGKFALLDGAHRKNSLEKKGYTHALCIILNGMTYEQRADYFAEQNKNSRPLNQLEKFKAKNEAQDELSVAVNTIVSKNGFTTAKGPNKIRSLLVLKEICEAHGAFVLDGTLHLIRETWGDEKLALRREFLVGVSEFVRRYGKADFVARMRQYDIYSIWRKYKELYASNNGASAVRLSFCASLVQHYNRGIKRNSRRFLKMEDYYLENLA